MNVYYLTPYSLDKKLGVAYNMVCNLVPQDDDWICILDGDTMFLNFDWGHIIYNAVQCYANEFSVFTCYASRIGGPAQQYNMRISEDTNILNHRRIAVNNAIVNQGRVKDITEAPFISGHFMLFPKWLWKEIKFSEKTVQGTMLGIDVAFFYNVKRRKLKIGLIEDLYLLHYYRLAEGIQKTDHLM